MSDNFSNFNMDDDNSVIVAKKRGVSRKTALIVLAVLTVLIVLPICAAYGYYHSKVQLLDYDDGTLAQEGVISETDSEVIADADAMEQAASGLEETEAIEAQGEIYSSEDVYNILLIGTDERTRRFSDKARGDSCMLFSINKKTMQVHLVSFERGMGVPVLSGQYKGQYDWLTHTFRYGGADLMMREISECFKVEVNHYVRVNFYTFEKVIDAVGGVDITLTELEAQGLNGEVETNAITKKRVYPGLNHLDGYDALQYSRIRYIDDDWNRIARQRKVIEAVIAKAKTMSIGDINDLLDVVLPLVRTNLTEGDITSLLLLAPGIPDITVEQMTIPAEGTYGSMTGMGGRKMFAADFEKNAQILHEALYGAGE